MDPYIGEIRLFSFGRVPTGWMVCNGTVLQIQPYQALFALIGTTYGGNGSTTFGLPDLRSRVPVGIGQGAGLSNYTLGEQTGVEAVTLNATQIAAHNHPLAVSAATATTNNPQNGILAEPVYVDASRASHPVNGYVAASDGKTLAAGAILPNAGGGAHNNIQPVLGLQFCIAYQGIFPSFD